MELLKFLNWIAEAESAETIAQLQKQTNMIIDSTNGLWHTSLIVYIIYGSLICFLSIWLSILNERVKKLTSEKSKQNISGDTN